MPSHHRISHLIVRLDTGGAEKSLFRLVRGTRGRLTHHVICFGPESPIGEDIAKLGARVTWLDYNKWGPGVLWQAWRLLRREPPDVLQGWMYFGNLIASLVALGLPRSLQVAWNIRQAPADFSAEKRRTRASIALARLPGLAPDLVIYNSFAGQQAHAQFGFNRRRHTVIPNGIDTDEFKPNPASRARWRTAHGVGDAVWVGLVCRFHPLKGVGEFLQAVSLLRKRTEFPVRFALAGTGMTAENPALTALMKEHQVSAQEVDLLGAIADPTQFLPALDVLVVASVREGTPNILLEAMASGVRTVATRVGDVERILPDLPGLPERIAAPADARDLAEKIEQALAPLDDAAERQRVQTERAFVEDFYQTEQCMAAYLNNYEELLS